MTKLLEQAITAVRGLAPADQDEIANAMLSLAGRDDREEIEPDHLDDVLAGLAEAERGGGRVRSGGAGGFRPFSTMTVC